ncbi:MAG: hypothetical protein ACRD3P_01320 [Terriglobales bacterium]
MRPCVPLVICALSIFGLAQTPPASTPAQSVTQVQAAAINALTFEQGNLHSLTKARTDFTPQGWNDFMKTLQGFLDDKGAPTYSSTFVPAGDAVVVNNQNGIVNLKIPGTLTQTSGASRTSYRLRVEVRAAGAPLKIEHLEPVTCLHAQAGKFCM